MRLPSNEFLLLAWSEVWQVTVLIVVVAAVSRLAARRRPHLAYALWLLVLLKCLTPPVWSSPTGIFSWIERRLGEERPARVPAAEAPTVGRIGNPSPLECGSSVPLSFSMRPQREKKAMTSHRTAPKMRGGKDTASPSPKPGLPLVSATLR